MKQTLTDAARHRSPTQGRSGRRSGHAPSGSALAGALVLLSLTAGCLDPPLPNATNDATVTAVATQLAPSTDFRLHELIPSEGSTQGFTQVELHGEGLDTVSRVVFGESEALDFLALSDRVLVAHTPPQPHGRVDVTIFDDSGGVHVLESAFMFRDPLQLHAVDPPTTHLFGGAALTLYGQGFSKGAVVLVNGKKSLETQFVNATTLIIIAPAGDQLGPVDVLVSGDAGVALRSDALQYVLPPRIESVTPPATLFGQPATIDIRGEAFLEPLLVSVNGVAMSQVAVHDSTLLTVQLPPALTPGLRDIAVATAHGTDVLKGAFADLAPSTEGLITLSPHTGSTQGGDVVTLTVLAHTPQSHTTVSMGGQPAELIEVNWSDHFVRIRTPSSPAGSVNVQIQTDTLVATLEDAFTFEPTPLVTELTPHFGPQTGGTRVTLFGQGFAVGASVRVGALAAVDVSILDATTLEFTTPAGAPGLANVRVIQGGHFDTLYGGFLYTGPREFWAVSPPTGAMAGNTLVALHGYRLDEATEVRFGEQAAQIMPSDDLNKLWVRTPPGVIGAVDVRVEFAEAALLRVDSFTYFDPASDGGLWGGRVAGNVNVTVFDFWTRERLEGAAVLLGDDAAGPLKGWTDASGQITLSATDLSGPLRLTVTKDGHQVGTLAGFDAQNVSFGLEPVPTCEMVEDMPCPDGEEEGQDVEVEVSHLIKGVKTPWGDCEGEEAAAGALCATCLTDSDCDHGVCTSLPDKGAFCSFGCQTMSDCPKDYLCLPVPGNTHHQCVPSAGEFKTYCDITVPSFQDEDPIAWPGVEVQDTGEVALVSRLGDFAIFCWSGLVKAGRFTPELLGIARGLHATAAGKPVVANVAMNMPLKKRIEIVLDRPDIGPETDQETVYIRVALDLGSEGLVEFPHIMATGRQGLETTLPAELTGPLYNARYALMAEVKSSYEPSAASVTVERGLADLQNDWAWRRSGDSWHAEQVSPDTVYGMAVVGDALFAVGEGGLIMRTYADHSWAQQHSGTNQDLRAVTAHGSFAIAGGAHGLALHFDGVTWKPKATPTDATIRGLSSVGEGQVFAVAGHMLLFFDGETWDVIAQASQSLRAVWAQDGSNVWVAGETGYLARFDGATFHTVATGTTATLNALWADDQGALSAVGDGGAFLQVAGDVAYQLTSGTTSDLHGLWGTGEDLWIVGERSTIVRMDGAGERHTESPATHGSTLRAVAAVGGKFWAMGSHELVLGPMMAIAEDVHLVRQSDGGVRASWSVQPGPEPDFSLLEAGATVGPCEACGMLFMIPYREWRATLAGGLQQAQIPSLVPLTGSNALSPGNKNLTITRALSRDPFEFNANQGQAFIGRGWRSWSTQEITLPLP